MHPADQDDEKLLQECDIERTRRKGPGGQHRNKVETAVILRHRPTGISAEANEKRSQADNRREAIFRLRLGLATKIRIKRDSIPGPKLKERIRGGKLSVNSRHRDFPVLLAEILDCLEMHCLQIPEAAVQLGISGSQILKFLRLHPPAFEYFNSQRESLHLPRIKF